MKFSVTRRAFLLGALGVAQSACGAGKRPALQNRKPRRFAVIIAGGKCDPASPWRTSAGGANLLAPPTDARLMAHLLEARFGFQKKDIILVGLDQQERKAVGEGFDYGDECATKKGIKAAIAKLLRAGVAQPQDYVVVYYSGHGSRILNKRGVDEGALVTWEGTPDKLLLKTELESLIARIPSKHITLILDSCESGRFTKSLSFPLSKAMPELEDMKGIMIEAVPKFLVLPGSKGGAAANQEGEKSQHLPIAASPRRFSILTACDDSQQALEVHFMGMEPVAVSAFTWALYRTLWQDQQYRPIEKAYPKITEWLYQVNRMINPAARPEDTQTPQFRRGAQGNELIAPMPWYSDAPRLPLSAVALDPLNLQVGRFGGISRSMRFGEKIKGAGATPQSILHIDTLGWFGATLKSARRPFRRFGHYVFRL